MNAINVPKGTGTHCQQKWTFYSLPLGYTHTRIKSNKEYLPNRSYANNSKIDNVLQYFIMIVDFLNIV